jgi:HAD superfamily hydrolase (TIGR01459 family)
MQELSVRYPVWFCDVWGVVHDGQRPFASSVEALTRHRRNGGTVILLTNSPRTSKGVEVQLVGLGVDPESHDKIVTSGDVTRELVVSHGGASVFHLGPSRDSSIFDGLAVERVPLENAHAVLCTGLFDDRNDKLSDYDPLFKEMKARNLKMICANPDKIVRNGERLLYCAGALAEIYGELGGTVLMAGKPYAPIYDLAMEVTGKIRGRSIERSDVLAIGDGPETDIKGAADYGLDCLLVADGVTDAAAGLAAVEASVRAKVPEARVISTMRQLAWD